jgi:hypothetical protein
VWSEQFKFVASSGESQDQAGQSPGAGRHCHRAVWHDVDGVSHTQHLARQMSMVTAAWQRTICSMSSARGVQVTDITRLRFDGRA